MENQVDLSVLQPGVLLLLAAVGADAILGDPIYRGHPIRLLGASLGWLERLLRAGGLDGRFGGVLLFLLLSLIWVGGTSLLALLLANVSRAAAYGFHLFMLFHMIALRDLLKHGMAIDRAAQSGDLTAAREATANLVARDTGSMDAAACRRAAIESMSESLVDGFISPIFWYALLGLPGVVLLKLVSTMDSMVGFKTPRYLLFGWCGARADDLLHFVPARVTWALMGIAAAVIPGCSGRKAWRIGWQQHAVVPGPNSGWSEAAAAGALERRLAGPIWLRGRLVTEVWLGEESDTEGGSHQDFIRAGKLIVATAAVFVVGVVCALVFV